MCYPDKSFFIWERKQDSWNLVTTVSSFSIWTLQDTINWSIYSLYSIWTYWEEGKREPGLQETWLLNHCSSVPSKALWLTAILPFHSKQTLHHTKKFRFYHHLLIYRDMWSAVALVAMIYGHISWFPVEIFSCRKYCVTKNPHTLREISLQIPLQLKELQEHMRNT